MRSVRELMDLDGRVAVITGGAGHLGRALGAALAELGAFVVLVDREESTGGIAQTLPFRREREGWGLRVDLMKEEDLHAIPEKVQARFGRIDVLVNNAAFTGDSKLKGWIAGFADQSTESWRAALELNLTVPFRLTQACSEWLGKSGHGSVINIGSTYGMVGPNLGLYEGTSMGNPAAYGASKGGLVQLTRYLATVLAPRVRANCISPGGIARGQPEAFVSRYQALTPLRRMATEEDVVGAAIYLASDLSAYVTGHNLVVDGGWTVW